MAELARGLITHSNTVFDASNRVDSFTHGYVIFDGGFAGTIDTSDPGAMLTFRFPTGFDREPQVILSLRQTGTAIDARANLVSVQSYGFSVTVTQFNETPTVVSVYYIATGIRTYTKDQGKLRFGEGGTFTKSELSVTAFSVIPFVDIPRAIIVGLVDADGHVALRPVVTIYPTPDRMEAVVGVRMPTGVDHTPLKLIWMAYYDQSVSSVANMDFAFYASKRELSGSTVKFYIDSSFDYRPTKLPIYTFVTQDETTQDSGHDFVMTALASSMADPAATMRLGSGTAGIFYYFIVGPK